LQGIGCRVEPDGAVGRHAASRPAATRLWAPGDADYTWNKTSNVLTIAGTASATALNSVNASVTTLTARSLVDATGGTVSATKVVFADGDATSPALYFSNDGDTGLYRIGANSMGVAASGAEVARFTTTGISTSTLIGNVAVSTTYLSATTASTTLLQLGTSSATCAASIQRRHNPSAALRC
jgi:hypothetical protein